MASIEAEKWVNETHDGGRSVLLEAEKWVNGPLGARRHPQNFFGIARTAQKLELQQAIGSLLHHARCNDPTILEAATRLASLQSHPTQPPMTSLGRLIGHVAKHPNNHRTIRPSNMLL